MSACARFGERILLAVDGSLEPAEHLELERHVTVCAGCAHELLVARRVDAALRAVAEAQLDENEVEQSLRFIRARLDDPFALGTPPRGQVIRRWTRIAVAAAVLIVLAAALTALVADRAPSPAPLVADEPQLRLDPSALDPRGLPRDVEHAVGVPHGPEESVSGAPTRDATHDGVAVAKEAHLGTGTAEGDTAEVDAARLAAARVVFAAALREPEVEAAIGVIEFARSVEQHTQDLARSGWPLVRFAERFAREDDVELARRALWFLAARGDTLSIAAVRVAARRPELARDAWLALAHVQPDRVDLLGPEARSAGAVDVALRSLVARGGQSAADALEEALLRAPPVQVAQLLETLAELGPIAIPALLRCGQQDRRTRAMAMVALTRIPGAGARLCELAGEGRAGFDGDALLDAFLHVPPEGPRSSVAIAWIAERATESRTRAKALACLGASDSTAALRLLVPMSARDPEARVDAAVLALVTRSSVRAVELAHENDARGQRRDQQCLLEVLSTFQHSCAVPGLLALAESPLLDLGDRRQALLVCGEIGSAADVDALLAQFPSVRERDLRAALLVALRTIGGTEAVARALANESPQTHAAIVALLADPELARHASGAQARIARELARRLAEAQP